MKTGVLVMAYGTPTTPDDVEAYYTRIRHGHAPTAALLSDLVRRYNAIGGTSPLAQRTADQVEGIARALEALSPDTFDVRFGSKYEPPMLEETAESFRGDGFTKVIGLVLAPHSSSMSTVQYMERARATLGEGVEFVEIGEWYEAPGFLELIASRVNEALARVPHERLDSTESDAAARERGVGRPTRGRSSVGRCVAVRGTNRGPVDRTRYLAGVARQESGWRHRRRVVSDRLRRRPP
jgi:ferrochelatase